RRYSSGMKRRGDSALGRGIQHAVEKGNSYPFILMPQGGVVFRPSKRSTLGWSMVNPLLS
ncbi:MAG: hypothetical protein WCB96_10725, partial [Candidatus Aminicenantales bacterium]